MRNAIRRSVTAILFLSVVLALGCERPEKVATAEAPQVEETLAKDELKDEAKDEVKEKADEQRATADKADQLLRTRLMGRVMETAKAEGFPAAVNVCHGEAGPITEGVGEELGVRIGRVADRLRNPENTGPDWVAPLIEEADGKAHYVAHEESLRAVKPIALGQPCLNCHGQTSELAEGVAEALAEHYPDDKATGYEAGDLRGWVWVEVL